jgi:serine/threonine protein kinase
MSSVRRESPDGNETSPTVKRRSTDFAGDSRSPEKRFPQNATDLLAPVTRESFLKELNAKEAGAGRPSSSGKENALPPTSTGLEAVNYRIVGEIAQGPRAIVYDACDTVLNRRVAMKILRDASASDPLESDLFWRKAQFLSQLDHPNFLKVFGVDPNRGWVIMERVKTSLDAKLSELPLAPNAARIILRQALKGLAFLHGMGRLHGHVNPSNILLSEKEDVRLHNTPGYDSCSEFPRPSDGDCYFPPELLSPEIFGPPGPGIDLYCVGLSIIESLKGTAYQELFKGVNGNKTRSGLEWMRWHASPTETLPPMQKVFPKLPEDLARVLDGLLKKNVYERYASAEEALADLESPPAISAIPNRALVAIPPHSEALPAAITLGTPPSFHALANVPASTDKSLAGAFAAMIRSWKERPAKKKVVASRIVFAALAACVFLLFAWPLLSPEPPKVAMSPPDVALAIDSDPQDASVQIDGKKVGRSPCTARLTPRQHVVMVEREGFRTVKQKVRIDANMTDQHLSFMLKPCDPPRLPAEPAKKEPPPPPPPLPLGHEFDWTPLWKVMPKPASVKQTPPEKERRPPQLAFAVFSVDLPDGLCAREKSEYFAEVRKILQQDWAADPHDAIAATKETLEKALYASEHDPRLNYAVALLLLKHHKMKDAIQQLDRAIANTNYPLFAPWLQRICLHVQERKYDQAAALCVEMLNHSIELRDSRSECAAAYERQWAEEAATESLRFAGWLFAYIDFQCARTSRKRPLWVEYDRLASLTEAESQLLLKTRQDVKAFFDHENSGSAGEEPTKSLAAQPVLNLPLRISGICKNAELPLEWQRILILSTLPKPNSLSRISESPARTADARQLTRDGQ